MVSRAQATRRSAQEAARRREEFIRHIAAGRTTSEAAEKVGVSVSRYGAWRAENPEFAARVNVARDQARANVKDFDGTFIAFRRMYLGMQTTWFQAKIIEAIERSQPGEVVLILIPPGHGKTTLLEDWCTYKLCMDSSFRITVASETVDHGMKIVDRVRMRLEADGPTPKIATTFGPFQPDSKMDSQVWGQRRFNVMGKRSSDERDYSMNCVGVTGRVQGTRCDLLLLDDMQDVKSLELSDKYYNIVTQSFLTRPEMFGRTVIIGTRVGEFDVYRKLIDNKIPDKVIRIPAYDRWNSPEWPEPKVKPSMDDPETWAPEGVKFLWPEKYDQVEERGDVVPGLHRFRYAALRFRLKEQTWWRNYMQRPEAASSMTFDEATTTAMRDEHRSVIADARPINHIEDDTMDHGAIRPVPIIIGVDPAVGGGNGIISVAARPKCMEVLTARLDYGLTKYSQIIEMIEEECHRFSTRDSVVAVVVIEDKAFQKGILQDDRMLEVQRRFGFRIVPNTTGREKKDKDIGVPALPAAMLRGQITIPWADDISQKEMSKLLDQLHMWRPGVNGVKLPQDLVMALWFCYGQWRGVRSMPVHADVNLDSWRGASSPIRRRKPRTVARRPYRSLRGGRP